MNIKKILSSVISFLLPILLFFIDICSFALMQQPILHTLLCLYIVQILQKSRPWFLALIVAGLLAESSIYYGSLLPACAYLIPLTVLGIIIKHTCYVTKLYRYALLISTLAAYTLLIEPYFLPISSPMAYTVTTIFVNMIVMTLM